MTESPVEKEVKVTRSSQTCGICGSIAAPYLLYGAYSCYSCRAFFRRSGNKIYICSKGTNNCPLDAESRKNCKRCRYQKCLDVGMKPDHVDKYLREKLDSKRKGQLNRASLHSLGIFSERREAENKSNVSDLNLDNLSGLDNWISANSPANCESRAKDCDQDKFVRDFDHKIASQSAGKLTTSFEEHKNQSLGLGSMQRKVNRKDELTSGGHHQGDSAIQSPARISNSQPKPSSPSSSSIARLASATSHSDTINILGSLILDGNYNLGNSSRGCQKQQQSSNNNHQVLNGSSLVPATIMACNDYHTLNNNDTSDSVKDQLTSQTNDRNLEEENAGHASSELMASFTPTQPASQITTQEPQDDSHQPLQLKNNEGLERSENGVVEDDTLMSFTMGNVAKGMDGGEENDSGNLEGLFPDIMMPFSMPEDHTTGTFQPTEMDAADGFTNSSGGSTMTPNGGFSNGTPDDFMAWANGFDQGDNLPSPEEAPTPASAHLLPKFNQILNAGQDKTDSLGSTHDDDYNKLDSVANIMSSSQKSMNMMQSMMSMLNENINTAGRIIQEVERVKHAIADGRSSGQQDNIHDERRPKQLPRTPYHPLVSSSSHQAVTEEGANAAIDDCYDKKKSSSSSQFGRNNELLDVIQFLEERSVQGHDGQGSMVHGGQLFEHSFPTQHLPKTSHEISSELLKVYNGHQRPVSIQQAERIIQITQKKVHSVKIATVNNTSSQMSLLNADEKLYSMPIVDKTLASPAHGPLRYRLPTKVLIRRPIAQSSMRWADPSKFRLVSRLQRSVPYSTAGAGLINTGDRKMASAEVHGSLGADPGLGIRIVPRSGSSAGQIIQLSDISRGTDIDRFLSPMPVTTAEVGQSPVSQASQSVDVAQHLPSDVIYSAAGASRQGSPEYSQARLDVRSSSASESITIYRGFEQPATRPLAFSNAHHNEKATNLIQSVNQLLSMNTIPPPTLASQQPQPRSFQQTQSASTMQDDPVSVILKSLSSTDDSL